MFKALHLRYDIDRLYMSRKWDKGNVGIRDSLDVSTQEREVYNKKGKNRKITAAINGMGNIKTD